MLWGEISRVGELTVRELDDLLVNIYDLIGHDLEQYTRFVGKSTDPYDSFAKLIRKDYEKLRETGRNTRDLYRLSFAVSDIKREKIHS